MVSKKGPDHDNRDARIIGDQDLVNSAIQEGIEQIMQHHPRFRDAQEYVSHHIDRKELQRGMKEIGQYIIEHGKDWSDEKKARFLHNNLTDFVASGQAFDKSAKEVILQEGLEESPRGRFFRRERGNYGPRGEREIDRVTDAFRDVYHLMKAGDHRETMPDLYESVRTIYNLGFLDSAFDVLKSRGVMSQGEYKHLKSGLRERLKYEISRSGEAVQNYTFVPKAEEKTERKRRVAAVVLGISGLVATIISGRSMTGNVVSTSSATASFAAWGVLIGLSLIIASLFMLAKKKENVV